MIRLKEKLIGYEAREMWSDFEQEWSDWQKATFLLKSDIVKPLSVDEMMWKSAFSPSMLEAIEQKVGKVGWVGGTWTSLRKLEHHLREYQLTDYWTIAITQFMDELELVETGRAYIPVEPDQIAPQWRFLGYDIAEEVLLSGLMNLGYRDDEKPIAQKYAPHLNQYHLFTDPDIALSFVDFADQRDPGHGPFYVYGLYQTNTNAERKNDE